MAVGAANPPLPVPSALRRPSARRRPTVGRSRPGPLWLFDLDNTLHHASHAIFPFINREMTAFIERTLAVDRDTANRLRTEYTQRYGATLLGLVQRNGVDARAFLRDVHPSAELASLLRAERGLAHALDRLPGRRIVLTNGPEQYARAVLALLGIERRFEQVIAIEQMRRGKRWHAKPDSAVIRGTLRRAGGQARDAILVEDTRGHLKRYRRMGLRTVWITGHLPLPVPRSSPDVAGGRGDATGSGASPVRAGQGRPHYVDRRVRSIKELVRTMRRGI
ncbi:pyrimidine 5'-nucleotidase [Robbsia betulipollinis]|uniref:pyrimidine 5'-nucleotidase n=1 Tax=Robbsia betulipollinis TaxID=2981849 RepID=UPI003D7A7173